MSEREVCLGLGYVDAWSHRYDDDTFRELHDALEDEIAAFFPIEVRRQVHVPMPPLVAEQLRATRGVEPSALLRIDAHLERLNAALDAPGRFSRGRMLATTCILMGDIWVKVGAFALLDYGVEKFVSARTLDGRASETVDVVIEARWVCNSRIPQEVFTPPARSMRPVGSRVGHRRPRVHSSGVSQRARSSEAPLASSACSTRLRTCRVRPRSRRVSVRPTGA